MDKSQLTVKSKNYSPLIGIIIASITFLVYLPALQNGFVNWDDNLYIYENPNIQSINLRFLRWIFSAEANATWNPLTMFSFGVEYAIWGLTPLGYHLSNVILHVINTALVFILAVQLIGFGWDYRKSVIAGALTALLFGIHPLHVESVAWVVGRTNILFTFFFLLSLLAYLKYIFNAGTKGLVLYIVSLIFFILSAMSKAMAISLPLILLIIDYYPLKRLTTNGGLIKKVLVEKIPFIILSFLIAIVTAILAAASPGRLEQPSPLIIRIFVAVKTLFFYIAKMALPYNLAPYYPYPKDISILSVKYVGSLILLIIITFLCVRTLKRTRLFLAIWVYYIITLIPVIGIIQVGGKVAADRYAYLPSLGLFFLLGLGGAAAFERYSRKGYRIFIIAMVTVILGLLIHKTIRQITVWHDSITLWSHQIKVFPQGTSIAYTNRGLAFDSLGNYRRAIEDYDKAIEVNPQDAQAYYNRGNDYNYIGEYRQAINDLSMAIELNPRDAKAYTNRGIAYYNAGGYQEAIADYNAAIRINPRDALAYYNMGLVYARLGDTKQAVFSYKKAAGLGLKQASESANSLD